jgi:hypothetical protein
MNHIFGRRSSFSESGVDESTVAMPRKGRDWRLTGERLERLLHRLDDDPLKAWMRYQRLNSKFTEMAQSRTTCDPQEVAEIIMGRLAGKLDETPVPSAEIEWFAYKVASLVVKEEDRKCRRLTNLDLWLGTLSGWSRRQRDKECLEWAIDKLPGDEQELLAAYYPQETPEGGLPAYRKLLAERLEITHTTLRQRTATYVAKAAAFYQDCTSKKEL